MRLITFRSDGIIQPGVLLPSGAAVPLGPITRDLDGGAVRTVVEMLGRGSEALRAVADLVAALDEATDERARVLVPVCGLELLPPMGANVLMVATSGNYLSHLQEMKAPPPMAVNGFIVSPTSLIGSGAAIQLPPTHPDMVDWEGELCLVFGRPCHRVDAKRAMDHVAGFTIFNDVSARDWVARTGSSSPAEAVAAWRANILFKQFPTFGPIGPAIVTADEIPDPDELELTTTVNGRVMQHDRVGNMRLRFGELIAELSEVYAFEPGDVITTGTPAGVGVAQDPPVFLRPGDDVVVSVDRIGQLINTVVASG